MKFNFITNFMVTALSFTVLGAYKAVAQHLLPPGSLTEIPTSATLFKCIPYGTDFFITVAQKGEREAALFVWRRDNFLPDLPPLIECNMVAKRLTEVVSDNGGSLKNLLLTMGRVKGETVICLVNHVQKGCNISNRIFSLTPEDARRYQGKSHLFLEKLTTFQQEDNARAIFQLTGTPINDIDRQPYFSLEAWERQFLKSQNACQVVTGRKN